MTNMLFSNKLMIIMSKENVNAEEEQYRIQARISKKEWIGIKLK